MFWYGLSVSAAQILEGMPMTIEVEKFLRAISPFYELVEEKKKISQVSDLSAGSCLRGFVCVVVKRTRNVTFCDLLPVQRSARLTKFARQLEGKYPSVATACLLT